MFLAHNEHDVIVAVETFASSPNPRIYILQPEDPDYLLLIVHLRTHQNQFAIPHLLVTHQLLYMRAYLVQ